VVVGPFDVKQQSASTVVIVTVTIILLITASVSSMCSVLRTPHALSCGERPPPPAVDGVIKPTLQSESEAQRG
jgi:hypothetical protein